MLKNNISSQFAGISCSFFRGYYHVCFQYLLDAFQCYSCLRNINRHFCQVFYRVKEFIEVG